MSNALGTVNPVEEIVRIAHARGVPVLIDGSQAAYHMPVDVQALDCDFYVATGHKLYGPTGIGVLYGKAEHLEAMPPFLGGGDMISSVTFEKSTWNAAAAQVRGGTPHIEGAIVLGVAIEYIRDIGLDAIAAHEQDLLAYGTAALQGIDGLRLDRHRAAQGQHPVVRARRHPPARHRDDRRSGRASRCARAITAPSRSWSGSACRRPRARRWRCTTPAKTSTRSSARWRG